MVKDIIKQTQEKDYNTMSQDTKTELVKRLNVALEEKGYVVSEAQTEDGKEYRAFFAKALKKFGVESPDELGDKEKEFFEYVKKNSPSKD